MKCKAKYDLVVCGEVAFKKGVVLSVSDVRQLMGCAEVGQLCCDFGYGVNNSSVDARHLHEVLDHDGYGWILDAGKPLAFSNDPARFMELAYKQPAHISREQALKRWPRICAHVICHSLGYATPSVAAYIVAASASNEPAFCEWINACYADNPKPAVERAIQSRKCHEGYMASYSCAKALVDRALAGQGQPEFASWF